jgi:predicted transcriptional regulator
MTVTTIKVDTEIRDRLASVARARGVTMSGLLLDICSELESRQRWVMIHDSYERLRRDDPEGWAEYVAELRAWDETTADPGDAAGEWPEYNQ